MEEIKVKVLGNKKIKISSTKEVVGNFYSIIPLIEKKDSVNHHILLVDVSGSMCSNLPKLKIKLKETLDALKESGNNYVSVILYSSHEECYRIINTIKCDEISYKMAQVYEKIDKELYTRSCTVISEPLQQAIDISETLANIADKHHIILFTDGCVVPTRWGYREEEEKCFDLAKICKEKSIFLNCIGFGNYYDRAFLRKLVELSGAGTVNHIDEIPQYYESVLEMVELVNNSVVVEVKIDNNDFYIDTNKQKYSNAAVIKNFKKNKENIVVVFDQDLIIDGVKYESNKNEVDDAILNDFLYGMTLNYVLYEDVDNAELLISQTGDIAAYNSLMNCYSFLEKGKVINKLQSLINNPSERFKEGKQEIKLLSIEEEPICLLEILQDILDDKKSRLLWDLTYTYHRITESTSSNEDEIKFIYPKDRFASVRDISIGSSKLNINIGVDINGQVMNTKNTMKMDAKICREYSLIKNGIINVDRIWAELSVKLKKKYKSYIRETIKTSEKNIYVLDLTKIKSTNKRMLKNITQQELVQYLYDIQLLAVKQWAIKQQIKSMEEKLNIDRIDLSTLSPEIIEARKLFRIDEKGIYKPLSVDSVISSTYEVYAAQILEWKVEKFAKKQEQAKYLCLYEKFVDLNNPKVSFEVLNEKLKEVQREKKYKERKVNLVRISSALMNKPVLFWETETIKPKKISDKLTSNNMVVNEEVVISTKEINNVQIRQDKYTLLVKCN